MRSIVDEAAASDAPEIIAARAEMDRLLTLLVNSGGSDLHLRVGQPPILRKDGQLVREDSAHMEEQQLRAMLLSTMAPRDTATFQETSDVDYAYALEGLARFRCNAGVDRLGPIGVFRIIPSQIPTCDELDLSNPIRNLCSLTNPGRRTRPGHPARGGRPGSAWELLFLRRDHRPGKLRDPRQREPGVRWGPGEQLNTRWADAYGRLGGPVLELRRPAGDLQLEPHPGTPFTEPQLGGRLVPSVLSTPRRAR